jgi:hypothetical protein
MTLNARLITATYYKYLVICVAYNILRVLKCRAFLHVVAVSAL